MCRISPFDVRTCKRQPEVPKSKPALIIKGKVIVGRERSERRRRRDDSGSDDSCRGLKVVSVRIRCRNFVEYSLLWFQNTALRTQHSEHSTQNTALRKYPSIPLFHSTKNNHYCQHLPSIRTISNHSSPSHPTFSFFHPKST